MSKKSGATTLTPKKPKGTIKNSYKTKSKDQSQKKSKSKDQSLKKSKNYKPRLKGKKARSRNNKKEKDDKLKEKEENPTLVPRTNSFGALDGINESDSDDEVFNVSEASDFEDSEVDDEKDTKHKKKEEPVHVVDDDIILLDSDSDNEGNDSTQESEQPQALPTTNKHNSLKDNDDYIGFDMSSGDESEDKDFQEDNEDMYEEEENEYLSNDEGTYHTKSLNHKAGDTNSKYPWIRNSDHSKQIEISDWLTIEIKDFAKYISPSADEIKARNETVQRLKSHVTSMWPDAELHCFGSYATDLYLPGSDIDMVIVSKKRNGKYDNKSSLYQLSSYLRSNKLAINIETIAKAKVPIIKFVDPQTKIHIDISFERTNGITAAELIISWIQSTPGLRELVLIVKQFLSVRKLNVVHTGGLGGFATICLVYAFLRLHPRIITKSIDPLENLGVLLIEFFELYGYNFGYDEVAVAFKDGSYEPMYVPKSGNYQLQGRNPFTLAIQDPHDSNNNISRGTFNLRDIKRAFGGAFELLANKCYDMNLATYKQRLGQSILGDIIRYKGKQRDFEDAREQVVNHAYEVASGRASSREGTTSASSGLPPLPSEKAGINPEDYEYTLNSDSDSDMDYSQFKATFEKSQSSKNKKSKKSGVDKSKEIDQLMGLEDEKEEASVTVTASFGKTSKEQDFSDSEDESDYDPTTAGKSAKAVLDKSKKRDYWMQKSGF